MAKYKVIFRVDSRTTGAYALSWESGCPALFTALQISRNTETSEAFLQLKVRNLSEEAISSLSIEAKLKLSDDTVDHLSLDFLDADIPAGAEKTLRPKSLPHGNIKPNQSPFPLERN